MNRNTRSMSRVLTVAFAGALALSTSGCDFPFTSRSAANNAVQPAAGSPPAAAAPPAAGVGVGTAGGAGVGSAGGAGSVTSAEPFNEAEFCRRTNPIEVALPEEDGVRQPSADLQREAVIWHETAAYGPASLRPDLELLSRDYAAVANGSRTLPQVQNEIKVAFDRVMAQRKATCLTEGERAKAGN